MIVDRDEFNKFLTILPEVIDDEVYFLSLSARQKYLNTEERIYYGLGRTEMFARTIVQSKETFNYAIRKMYNVLEYKTTKTGLRIPEKATVAYININPSSMLRAFTMLKQEMEQEVFEITRASLAKKEPNFSGIRHLERRLMNCIQKARGRKIFMDIDFDTKHFELIEEFKEKAIENIHIIQTHGGFHALINVDAFNKKLTELKGEKILLNKIVEDLNEKAKKEGGEVIFNKNQMVPLPGTLQAGVLVKMI